MESGLYSDRSPCPGFTLQVSHCILLAPMGGEIEGRAWRRPGTQALCTRLPGPGFHR